MLSALCSKRSRSAAAELKRGDGGAAEADGHSRDRLQSDTVAMERVSLVLRWCMVSNYVVYDLCDAPVCVPGTCWGLQLALFLAPPSCPCSQSQRYRPPICCRSKQSVHIITGVHTAVTPITLCCGSCRWRSPSPTGRCPPRCARQTCGRAWPAWP